jgi:hypothetical protein
MDEEKTFVVLSESSVENTPGMTEKTAKYVDKDSL